MKCNILIPIGIIILFVIIFYQSKQENYSTRPPSECIYIANQRPCAEGTYCMIPGGIDGTCRHDSQNKVWCCPTPSTQKFGPCCGKKCTVSYRP